MDSFDLPDIREEQAKALSSAVRMKILHWLKTPELNFADQASGDPAEIGVCVTLITGKLGMSQPTVSRHLELLKRAGFLTVQRIGKWSYYQRNEEVLTEFRSWLSDTL